MYRRVSRTDLDFEQALRAEGTVMLQESIDVNRLGVDASPSPVNKQFDSPANTSRTPRLPQPSTPIVVPPTPSPTAGPSTSRLPAPSPSSSSHDLFPDDDGERQTNRRSIYRSPGTSSSPDLATLLRKAKEKGGVVGAHQKKEKRRESPPPLPGSHDRPPNGTRQRASPSFSANPVASVSPQVTPLPKGKLKAKRSILTESSPDWVMTSPRPQENGKPPKTSVRAKTSAFLGKMIPGRERSKTNATYPSTPITPSVFQAFTPPVPPLPVEPERTTPVGSPIADVFITPQRSHHTKPLPPIVNSPTTREGDDRDDQSLVLVEKIPLTSSSDGITPSKSAMTPSSATYGKRRSMSVGEVELKKAMAATSSVTPLPPTKEMASKQGTPSWGDTTLSGIISDFKGELCQLDPISSSSLDLRDPSTPARRTAHAQSKANSLVLPQKIPDEHAGTGSFTSSLGGPPALSLQLPLEKQISPSLGTAPIIPPRANALQISVQSTSRPNSVIAPRVSTSRHGSSPLRTQNTNIYGLTSQNRRDSARLRGQHRSTASSSEPSLIPIGDGARALLPNHMSSHQDLTVNDLRSLSTTKAEDSSDIETRGKDLASKCWQEDEDFRAKDKIAEWLGGQGRINKVALYHYVNFFDFSGLRLDVAFRRLCAKLYLKGETQQVDRILEEFSRRYWECNPGALYGSANIVHAVSYSLLLLNTDLHVAELTTRMSRSQFVRNTLTAIQIQLQSDPPSQVSTSDLTSDEGSNGVRKAGPGSVDLVPRSKRSDSITSWNSISREAIMSSPVISLATSQASSPGEHSNGSNPSLQASTLQDHKPANSVAVYGRTWENDMESLLKEMYNAIKSQQILQPLNSSIARSSTSSLSPGMSTIMRNRSFRGPPDRLTTLKRGSIRGLQSIIGTQSGASPYSSNSSIDGRVSPSPSFATSTHEVGSLRSGISNYSSNVFKQTMYGSSSSFLPPTLGFASNLSNTIIREAQEDDNKSIHSHESNATTISITDEELALLGAPWAKEGMLCRKQYWESAGKRAKDKAWLNVFVVIQKGELNMFTFGEYGSGGTGIFGGGNWLANARAVGTIHLSHSLTHALPPPGYNRQRPYCMVVTLANGGVYFFQAGTEELVNEWVSTCNYWAARTSKEPLAGGVSNMEYGWNRVADSFSHGRSLSDTESTKDVDHSDVLSVRSGRSSRSKFGWRDGTSTVRASHTPWADRTFINDWKPPLPPVVYSVHDEETQLEALQKHAVSMKADLMQHNMLREPMAALYQPRTANAGKAQSNWEKKSQYLLTEIVKYDSYIESLQAGMSLRLKKRGEKALEQALSGASPESPNGVKGKWNSPEETIQEDDEPHTPGPNPQSTPQIYRRDTAEGGDVDD